MEGQHQSLKGECEKRSVGLWSKYCDFQRIRRVGYDLDRKRCSCSIEQSRMHEAVFVAIVVPEQHAGFPLLSPADSFGLQIGARFAVEFVGDCYVGGLVESH